MGRGVVRRPKEGDCARVAGEGVYSRGVGRETAVERGEDTALGLTEEGGADISNKRDSACFDGSTDVRNEGGRKGPEATGGISYLGCGDIDGYFEGEGSTGMDIVERANSSAVS